MATQAEISLNITGELMKGALKSFSLSKRFTKIMVNCTILNILAQRMVVNESDLKQREVDGVPFFVFKRPRNIKDKLFKMMLQWMDGIKDAIEKNYLKNIFLFIKNPSNDDILESYRFNLKYNLEQETVYRPTLVHVKDDTVAMFEMLIKLGQNPKLQENAVVEIEFTYNNDTPRIYEPPGFEVAMEPYCKKFDKSFKHRLCTMNTGFHKIVLVGNEMNEMTSEPNNEKVQNLQKNKDAPENETETLTSKKLVKSTNSEYVTAPQTEEPKATTSKFAKNCWNLLDETVISLNSEDDSISFVAPNCVCSLSSSLVIPLIKCSKCKKLCHAPCYGFIEEEKYDSIFDFRCLNCDTTDLKLKDLPPNDRTTFAKTRVVLYFLRKDGKVNNSIMKTFPKSTQNDIYRLIDGAGIFLPNKTVDPEKLKCLIKAFSEGLDSQFLE